MGRLVEPIPSGGIELTSAAETPLKDYAERTAKYIPSEIVAAYVSLINIIKSVDPGDELRLPVSWLVFFVCLAVTPAYLFVFAEPDKPSRTHLFISTVAFAIWGYALGGPFELAQVYKPWVGAVLLGVFTLLAGLVIPKK